MKTKYYFSLLFILLNSTLALAQKEEVENLLKVSECSSEDIEVISENKDFTVLNNNPEKCKLSKENHFYLGALLGSYFVENAVGIGAEYALTQGKKTLFHLNLDYSTNRLLQPKAAPDYFQQGALGFNYHIAKSPFFVGPNLNLMHVHNDAIYSTQDRTLVGGGASLGFQKLFFDKKLLTSIRANYTMYKSYNSPIEIVSVNLVVGWRISKGK